MANIRIINTRFSEIEAKRNPDFSGKLELKTNIQIKSIKKDEKSKDIMKVNYVFEVDYGDLGKIKIEGDLFLLSDPKTIKTTLKNIENKDYNKPEYITISNLIIQKASIKAFELEEELGLPIHIKLPSLSTKEK